jgi:predicted transcriptional regulator of viral defense system
MSAVSSRSRWHRGRVDAGAIQATKAWLIVFDLEVNCRLASGKYALRLSVGAVIRRLGYLVQLFEIVPESELAKLQRSLTATYAPLDPVLPRHGPHLARWRLQVNISADELKAVRST